MQATQICWQKYLQPHLPTTAMVAASLGANREVSRGASLGVSKEGSLGVSKEGSLGVSKEGSSAVSKEGSLVANRRGNTVVSREVLEAHHSLQASCCMLESYIQSYVSTYLFVRLSHHQTNLSRAAVLLICGCLLPLDQAAAQAWTSIEQNKHDSLPHGGQRRMANTDVASSILCCAGQNPFGAPAGPAPASNPFSAPSGGGGYQGSGGQPGYGQQSQGGFQQQGFGGGQVNTLLKSTCTASVENSVCA